jgi:bisanhydrobacterioruberin hydratase
MYQGIPIKRQTIESISQNKIQWATGIALLIHSVGLLGMIWIDKLLFARMTSLNLLLMFFLIIWSQPEKKFSFYIFVLISFLGGMISEMIGVQTGLLFGLYTYGPIMGFQFANVPLIIGLNWFVVLYSALATVHFFMDNLFLKAGLLKAVSSCSPINIKRIFVGALLAVFFDWVMEPVAMKLGFWTWAGDGQIPLLNYLSWFLIATIFLSIFRVLKIKPDNIFAVHLFLIQIMFFLLLRIFL